MDKRTRSCAVLLAVVMILVFAVPSWGDAVGDKRKAQAKLMAYRAARVDAIRKLGERIRGLRVTSKTTVKDFVTESDTIRTAMTAYLTSVREAAKPKWHEDGTCEVVMAVTLEELVFTLKHIHTRYYKGSKFKVTDFDKMTITNKLKVIRETGMGAPPDYSDDPVVNPKGSLRSLSHLRGAAKAYWLARCKPQGRLMAVRAARVEALRRLSERIVGVMITSRTSVRDFVTEFDDVKTFTNAFIRGARETGIRYHRDELIVEVELAVTLRDYLIQLKTWAAAHYKGSKVTVRQWDEVIVKSKDRVIKETGMGVPPEKYLKQVTVVDKRAMALGSKAPGWLSETARAVGNGAMDPENTNKAQARLMALRAAELDARRKLAERIDGLMITSKTSVHDFVTASDQIRTAMLTFQQGGYVVKGSQKVLADGTAQVTVALELKPLWDIVLYYQRKLSITIK